MSPESLADDSLASDDLAGGVAVCAPSDPFRAVLAEEGTGFWQVLDPPALADSSVTLGPEGMICNGRRVRALHWAPPPVGTLAASFDEEERAFVDQEVLSLWSAAAALPALRCNLPGWGFHAFQSSRWLALARAAGSAGHRLAPAVSGGACLWLAHSADSPIAVSEANLPGAATVADSRIAWWWSAGTEVFDDDEPGRPATEAALALARTFDGLGYRHVRFGLAPDGALVTASPFAEAATGGAGRRRAAIALAAWYGACAS